MVRDWNNIPMEVRNTSSPRFKNFLGKGVKISKFFNTGTRPLQISHARLRLECSSLNLHLYKKNLVEDPSCICGEIESAKHFLLHCPRYHDTRLNTIYKLPFRIDVNVLLYGDANLTENHNIEIFITVQKYILMSKRFST